MSIGTKNKILNHGLLISKQGLRIADEPAYSSEKQPIYSPCEKSQIKLVLSTNCKDSFLLNHFIDPSDIDSEYYDWISEIDLLSNESNKSSVFLGLLCPRAELIFENRKLKPLDKLNDAVEKALKHYNPYHELLKIFKIFGHFLPKKIILGHRLYRSCYLAMKEDSPEQFTNWEDFGTDYDFATCNDDILNKWEKCIKLHTSNNNDKIIKDKNDFYVSFLLSTNNDKVMRNELNKWVDSCLKSEIDLWQVINWKGLYPLYKILDEKLQKEIKVILGIDDQTKKLKERILMTGVIPIEGSTYYYRIKFPVHLNSNNYKIFGKLVTQNGEPIDSLAIRFQSMTISGFSAIIENFDANINTRNISVLALGIHSSKCKENYKFSSKVPKDLPENSVICASILHSSYHYGITFTIQDDDDNGDETKLIMNVDKKEIVEHSNNEEDILEDFSSDEENDNDISEDNEYFLQWCCFLIEDYKDIETDIITTSSKATIKNLNIEPTSSKAAIKNLNAIGQMYQDVLSSRKEKE
ncbi:7353_t:CDS:2, partial [Scutellospora calospora]